MVNTKDFETAAIMGVSAAAVPLVTSQIPGVADEITAFIAIAVIYEAFLKKQKGHMKTAGKGLLIGSIAALAVAHIPQLS